MKFSEVLVAFFLFLSLSFRNLASSQAPSGAPVLGAPALSGLLESVLKPTLDPSNVALSSWVATSPCFQWKGVVCDRAFEVTSINISRAGLNGSLPAELGQITTLTYLNLHGNWLSGSIPDSIGNLTSLRTLDLGDNILTGSIPDSLSKLTALTALDLSSNSFSGEIPSLSTLTALQTLDFSSNGLSGSIPDIFTNMAELSTIVLSANKFNGTVPSSVYTRANLTFLNLAGNDISDNLSISFATLPKLGYLNVSNNNFSGGLPFQFTQQSSPFRTLDLSFNAFFGNLPTFRTSSLTQLYLAGNHFTGHLIPSFANPPPLLEVIDLSSNSFAGPIPSQFGQLTSLITLDLHSNLLSGNLPENLSSCTGLSKLDLSFNSLSGPLPLSYTNFTKLVQINIGSNSITGSLGSYSFAAMASCIRLSMGNNQFTGTLPIALPPGIATVDFSSNNLGGTINGPLFAPLTNLSTVLLSDNSFSGGVPYQLLNSSSLLFVSLNNNSLSDPPSTNVAANVANGIAFVLLGGNPICDNGSNFPGLNFPNTTCEPLSDQSPPWTPSETTAGFPEECTVTCAAPLALSIPAYNQGGKACVCSQPLNVTILLPDCSFLVYTETFDALSALLRSSLQLQLHNLRSITLDINQVWVSGASLASAGGAQLVTLQFFAPASSPEVIDPGLASRIVGFFRTDQRALSSTWGPITFVSAALTPVALPAASGAAGDSSGSSVNRAVIIAVSVLVALVVFLSLFILVWFFCFKKKGPSAFDREVAQYFVRHFPLAEVMAMTGGFSSVLGEGGYGIVYLGTLESGEKLAVKRAKDSEKTAALEEFKKEVRAISRMAHVNIVKLIGYCDDSGEQILIYEFCENGTLKQLLHPKVGPCVLTFDQRLQIAVGVAEGIRYMHIFANPSAIHRDIKSDNILIDDKWTAKVADFGLLKDLPKEGTELEQREAGVAGTPGYLDPEYFLTYRATPKSDVYSFGVVLLELITGKTAIFTDTTSEDRDKLGLASWASPYMKLKKYSEIVDPSLAGNYPADAMDSVIQIACDCVERLSLNRPDITEVANRLGGISAKAILEDRQSKRPEPTLENSGSERSQFFADTQWSYSQSFVSETSSKNAVPHSTVTATGR